MSFEEEPGGMIKAIAWVISNALFYAGHATSKLFERYEWGWAYDLYVWLMQYSVKWNNKYGLDVWVVVDEHEEAE